ncbi:helix-loop-helix protein delilah [Drosophila tropicalis]|uniref:helix-loop-helix protein delilah n=1 Tax=Drosophila tropicalis TaxID=46794 RepID=UPI0035ABA9C3
MKSNTYELHNYADLEIKDTSTRKRKASNDREEKYSLRQKKQKKNAGGLMDTQNDGFLLEDDEEDLARTVKSKRNSSTKKAKTKAKAPPLSKYRRKTANARERSRMKEINQAFETLRNSVPQAITGEDPTSANEKLTKITTLRMAMKYINMLNECLEDPSYENDFIVECLEESARRESEPMRLAEENPTEEDLKLSQAIQQQQQPQKKKNSKAKTAGAASKKTSSTSTSTSTPAANKRPSKASKAKQAIQQTQLKTNASSSTESCYASSSIGSPPFISSPCSSSSLHTTAACSPSSAYASLSSSASCHGELETESLFGSLQAISDLNALLLESEDGESLSHPCFNPSYPSLLSVLPSRGDMTMSSHVLDKPDVELSLRLLDQSTSDSFDFSNGNQQPSACISPLATLADTFHPFADLLHGDLSDMFLT